MTRKSNIFIGRAMDLSRELSALADEGEAVSEDDGCIVLYGVIRDCAYNIRTWAERERDRHKMLGLWENEGGKQNEDKTTAVHVDGNPGCNVLDSVRRTGKLAH